MRIGQLQYWVERGRSTLAHPRLPDAASVLLVAVLGWQGAGLTWAALPAAETARPAAEPIAGGNGAGDSGAGEAPTARLARLHLFGEADAGDAPGDDAGETATDAPETQLNLSLKGVYAHGESGGLAIITSGGGPEKVYATGDTVAGSARITGVFHDRVVLRRDGRPETLRLEGAERIAPQEEAGGDDQRGARPGGDVIDRARAMRERLRQNPFEMARMVRFQPYTEDGELLGYRVQPRSDEARLLREVGIREDDIVTRINGIPLDNPQQGNRALQALRDASMINVTVLRDGRSRRLSIPLGDPG